MSLAAPPATGHGAHRHRTWLHLLPRDPEFIPSPNQLDEAVDLLVLSHLAIRGPEPGTLLPGPAFAEILLPGQLVPLAGPARGEVRLDAGVLRCYPDPGSEGFDTDPPRGYRAGCPGCSGTLEFFTLRFPNPDPMRADCPTCGASIDISQLDWSPRLPAARAELTFGDLGHRPSLRSTAFFGQLEAAWGTALDEAYVTL
jgi:hypothetical protein